MSEKSEVRALSIPVPSNLDEAWRFASMLAKSELVPKDYRGKPENCLVAMQWGADIGLAGLQAIQNIAVINGRPTIWGDAALALVMAHPSFVDIEERIEGSGDAMVACCTVKRKGRTPITRKFSVQEAKIARLLGKEGTWQSYMTRMLQLRARGYTLRDGFPDVLRGMGLAEEAVQTFEKAEIDMGTVEVVKQPVAREAEIIDGHVIEEPVKQEQEKPDPVKPESENKMTGPADDAIKEDPVVTAGFLTMIRKKAEARTITEPEILAHFKLDALEGVKLSVATAIMAWIANPV